jgi:hypothetical protein
MSGAAAAVPATGPRSGAWRTAELLCALSYGAGLAAAERMEHGTNTAFVGIQLGRALGLGTDSMEAVFYGALLKDVGCGACGAVLTPFLAEDRRAPLLGLNLVDLHSPRSMVAWAMDGLRLDPSLPGRLARLAAFASQCGSVAHEAMAAHCEIAADFTVRLGFGRYVQDAVYYQHERYDGRGPAFHRRAETIPRPAQVLHLVLAADLVRGLTGADAAAAMVRQRAGSYFDPQVAEAYLDLAGGLWPPGDDPIPLSEVLSCDPGTPVDQLPGDRRLAVCEALADFADLKSVRRGTHSHTVATLASQAAARLGLPSADQEHLHRAGLVHDLGQIAVRTACCRRQTTTPAQPATREELPRWLSQSACIPTMPSASCPGSAPSPTWPQTSAPITSASTVRATRWGLPLSACPSPPGCSPPPMPGRSGPALAHPASPAKKASTRRAWLRSGPATSPVPATSASVPVPIRPARPSARASSRYCACSPTGPPIPTSARPCTSAGVRSSTMSSTSSSSST